MKKKLYVFIATICTVFALSGCNSNLTVICDLQFNKAMIKLADDSVITVDVESYRASTNSVIIFTKDGKKYGVAYTDATFFND